MTRTLPLRCESTTINLTTIGIVGRVYVVLRQSNSSSLRYIAIALQIFGPLRLCLPNRRVRPATHRVQRSISLHPNTRIRLSQMTFFHLWAVLTSSTCSSTQPTTLRWRAHHICAVSKKAAATRDWHGLGCASCRRIPCAEDLGRDFRRVAWGARRLRLCGRSRNMMCRAPLASHNGCWVLRCYWWAACRRGWSKSGGDAFIRIPSAVISVSRFTHCTGEMRPFEHIFGNVSCI